MPEATTEISFIVYGDPRPQGSKTMMKQGDRRWMTEGTGDAPRKLEEWRREIKLAASTAMNGDEPFVGPVELTVMFLYPFRSQDLGTGRNAGIPKPSAPEWKDTLPDLTKLVRAIEDALARVAYYNDSQVASLRVVKKYNVRPRTAIMVKCLGTRT